ncbi:AMP-binding protein [soil metagenome]
MRNIPVELAQRYEQEGWWTPDTLGNLVARGLAAAPDADFKVHSAVRPYSGTYAEVELTARRLAGGLAQRGVGPGDVVAFQLPNWQEAAATFWATALLGAVVVPIVHFYGRKELGHILADAKPKVFITVAQFGRMTYAPDVSAHVPIVGVVGGGDPSVAGDNFEDLLADEPMTGVMATDPAGPALIAYTSGTTSSPKGVVHSHYGLVHETHQLVAQNPHDSGKQLTATPVGHFIGMVGALLMPVIGGNPINLADVWDPGLALSLMRTDGLAIGGGPPYFVTSLLDHPDFTADHLAGVRVVGLGGSSVPIAVTQRLANLGITTFRSYGSTEHPSITGSRYDEPESKRLYTDGKPLSGVEVCLADDGEILSRGPDLCLGYTDDVLTDKAFDEDGWYHTGDVGILDEDGYLTITDRKTDIIIRGGENISALEVEETLLAMPGVAEAVVVAVADARFGEHAAAVLRMHPGHDLPRLDDVRTHFESCGMARQKWPEELQKVDDFPRTASGKVQKFKVRRDISCAL